MTESFSPLLAHAMVPCIGFKTANNKTLTVSAKSWIKAQEMIKDVDITNGKETSKNNVVQCSGFTTASKKPLSVSASAWKKAEALVQENDDLVSKELSGFSNNNDIAQEKIVNDCDIKLVQCSGFATASKKPLSVSASAWKKAEALVKQNDDLVSKELRESSNNNDITEKTIVEFDCNFAGNSKIPTSCTKDKDFHKENISAKSFSFFTPKSDGNRVPQAHSEKLKGTSGENNKPFFNTSVKGKRRNSVYKPPRRKLPLHDANVNLLPKFENDDTRFLCSDTNKENPLKNEALVCHKTKLGMKQDQESQILVSDESLLRALAMFEGV